MTEQERLERIERRIEDLYELCFEVLNNIRDLAEYLDKETIQQQNSIRALSGFILEKQWDLYQEFIDLKHEKDY